MYAVSFIRVLVHFPRAELSGIDAVVDENCFVLNARKRLQQLFRYVSDGRMIRSEERIKNLKAREYLSFGLSL